jgi:hypothetical protein
MEKGDRGKSVKPAPWTEIDIRKQGYGKKDEIRYAGEQRTSGLERVHDGLQRRARRERAKVPSRNVFYHSPLYQK